MVPEFPSQRCQWRAKSGVETSHIYKKILFGRKGFSFRKDAEVTQIWPPEQKVLVQELKIYPS